MARKIRLKANQIRKRTKQRAPEKAADYFLTHDPNRDDNIFKNRLVGVLFVAALLALAVMLLVALTYTPFHGVYSL